MAFLINKKYIKKKHKKMVQLINFDICCEVGKFLSLIQLQKLRETNHLFNNSIFKTEYNKRFFIFEKLELKLNENEIFIEILTDSEFPKLEYFLEFGLNNDQIKNECVHLYHSYWKKKNNENLGNNFYNNCQHFWRQNNLKL